MTTPRATSRHRLLAASLVATLALVAGPAAPGVATAPSWSATQRVVLPNDGVSIPQGYLPALACPSATDCVAVGTYSTASGLVRGLIAQETRGHWSARPIPLPSDASRTPGLTPYQVACATTTRCAIVGGYQDTQGSTRPFVTSLAGTTWTTTRLSLPTDALTTGQNAQARAVACPSVTTCVVVGTYLSSDPGSPTEAFAAFGGSSGWSPATRITLPPIAAGMPATMVSQMACSSATACLAAGIFVDQDNVQHVFVTSETAGHWSPATTLAPPANASLYAHVTVGGVACVATSCTVVGTYLDHAGRIEPYAATSRAGAWAPSIEIALPASAASDPLTMDYGYVGLACAAPGSCVTGGQFVDTQGRYQGFLATETGGVWAPATEMPLPAGATSAGHNGGVVAFSCIAAGDCRAGAAYLDARGHYQAMIVSLLGGTWRAGAPLALPSGATSVGVDGGVYALVCQHDGTCVATGSYQAPAGAYQGFTVQGG